MRHRRPINVVCLCVCRRKLIFFLFCFLIVFSPLLHFWCDLASSRSGLNFTLQFTTRRSSSSHCPGRPTTTTSMAPGSPYKSPPRIGKQDLPSYYKLQMKLCRLFKLFLFLRLSLGRKHTPITVLSPSRFLFVHLFFFYYYLFHIVERLLSSVLYRTIKCRPSSNLDRHVPPSVSPFRFFDR